MKYLSVFIFFFLPNLTSYSQDSTLTASSWYFRTMPFSMYSNAGKYADRVSQNIEFGKSFEVLDLGLAYGRNSLRPDSTSYLQARITMDACQYGIFSNEVSIGVGKLFNSATPMIFEYSTTILAQVSKKIGVGVIVGNYDFTGEVSDVSKQFFGVFFRIGLMRNEDGFLVKRPILRPFRHVKKFKKSKFF
jgi:hypothetical protein